MVLVAKDIIEKEFLTFSRDTTASDAARLMKAKRHGYAIVTSHTGSPEGIVTEWDYLSKIVAESRDPSKIKLGDIMTSELVSVDANVGLDQVAQLMTQKGVRRVLVMKDAKVIGVVTAAMMLSRLKEYVDKVSTTIARLQSPMM